MGFSLWWGGGPPQSQSLNHGCIHPRWADLAKLETLIQGTLRLTVGGHNVYLEHSGTRVEWLMVHSYLRYVYIPFATFFLVPLVLVGSFWLRGRQLSISSSAGGFLASVRMRRSSSPHPPPPLTDSQHCAAGAGRALNWETRRE